MTGIGQFTFYGGRGWSLTDDYTSKQIPFKIPFGRSGESREHLYPHWLTHCCNDDRMKIFSSVVRATFCEIAEHVDFNRSIKFHVPRSERTFRVQYVWL